MARRNMDWLVGWWTEQAEPSLPSATGQVILPLVSDADLASYEDDVIVERVIGQYLLANPGTGDSYHIHARLTVRPESDVGVWSASIENFTMADEKFLWHKIHVLSPQTRNMGPDVHPEWSHLDVRVNRKVEELERLCLIFEPTTLFGATPGTDPFNYAAWIRVLVKT